jgi:hypothetical protein
MKKTTLGVGVFLLLLLAAAGLFPQEQAAPVYREGDYWWYRFAGRIYELVVVDGKLKIFNPKPKQKVEITGERAKVLSNFAKLGEGERGFVVFPIAVGKQWTLQYDTGEQGLAPRGGTFSLQATVTNRVTGIENVETPAGTFRSFKIERSESIRRKDWVSGSVYYSPQTRSVVKYEFSHPRKETRVYELTKFGSAEGK